MKTLTTALLICLLALVGCSGDEESGSDVAAEETGDNTEATEETATEMPSELIAFCFNETSPELNWDIFVIAPDGSDLTRLTDSTASEQYPVFSPDGSKIAFVSDGSSDNNIYVMDTDGGNQTQLTTDGGSEPTWSPDGSQLAFIDGWGDIYIMDADGGNLTQLTETDEYESNPAWSPDGKQLAFSAEREWEFNIYLMSVEGGEQIQLTTEGGEYPAWSPDGSQIAFISNRDEDSMLDTFYVMNADGSEQTQITTDSGSSPAWSPDGSQLAYEGFASIFVMNADGSNPTLLVDKVEGMTGASSYPDWFSAK